MILFSFSAEHPWHRGLQNLAFDPLVDDENIIHWINHLHFFDPLHYFRKKLCIKYSKQAWLEKEFSEMKIRNLQSLLILPKIFWRVSSTEDDWIFGWRSRLTSLILILFWSFTLFHCGWMFFASRYERMPHHRFTCTMKWDWFTILKILRIVHTMYFILQFLCSSENSKIVFLVEFSSYYNIEGRTLEFP